MPKLKDASRNDYWANGATATIQELQLGAVQRIADAQERIAANSDKMASNYTRLQSDLDYYKRLATERREENRRLGRRINALHGVITKLKNKKK